jgi:hypothetical protein
MDMTKEDKQRLWQALSLPFVTVDDKQFIIWDAAWYQKSNNSWDETAWRVDWSSLHLVTLSIVLWTTLRVSVGVTLHIFTPTCTLRMVTKSYDWQVICNQTPPGLTYLYLIDDCNRKRMLRTAPVRFSVIDIPDGHQTQSVVYDPTLYQWSDQNWIRKSALTDLLRSPLSIYEMEPKSWKYGVSSTSELPSTRSRLGRLLSTNGIHSCGSFWSVRTFSPNWAWLSSGQLFRSLSW